MDLIKLSLLIGAVLASAYLVIFISNLVWYFIDDKKNLYLYIISDGTDLSDGVGTYCLHHLFGAIFITLFWSLTVIIGITVAVIIGLLKAARGVRRYQKKLDKLIEKGQVSL